MRARPLATRRKKKKQKKKRANGRKRRSEGRGDDDSNLSAKAQGRTGPQRFARVHVPRVGTCTRSTAHRQGPAEVPVLCAGTAKVRCTAGCTAGTRTNTGKASGIACAKAELHDLNEDAGPFRSQDYWLVVNYRCSRHWRISPNCSVPEADASAGAGTGLLPGAKGRWRGYLSVHVISLWRGLRRQQPITGRLVTRFTGLSAGNVEVPRRTKTMQVRAQIDTIQGEMPLASRGYKEVVKLLIRPLGCM